MEIPMCHMCGEFEVGMFAGGTSACCSAECADQFDTEYDMDAAGAEADEFDAEYDTDGAPIDTQGWADSDPYTVRQWMKKI